MTLKTSFYQGFGSGRRKTFAVDHDATVVEADGTEVRIAPLDVQYQNATIWGKLITNFAGPMNNFILGVVVLDFNLHAGWRQRC